MATVIESSVISFNSRSREGSDSIARSYVLVGTVFQFTLP